MRVKEARRRIPKSDLVGRDARKELTSELKLAKLDAKREASSAASAADDADADADDGEVSLMESDDAAPVAAAPPVFKYAFNPRAQRKAARRKAGDAAKQIDALRI